MPTFPFQDSSQQHYHCNNYHHCNHYHGNNSTTASATLEFAAVLAQLCQLQFGTAPFAESNTILLGMSGGRWNKKAGQIVKEIAVPMEVDPPSSSGGYKLGDGERVEPPQQQ